MTKQASSFKGYDNTFAVRLRKLLDETNTTQQVLAEKTNCTRQAIAQYVGGLNAPNVDKLISIAEFFGVSTDYLLGLTDAATTNIELKAMCDYTGLTEKTIETLHIKQNNFYYMPSLSDKTITGYVKVDFSLKDKLLKQAKKESYRGLDFLNEFIQSFESRQIIIHLNEYLGTLIEVNNIVKDLLSSDEFADIEKAIISMWVEESLKKTRLDYFEAVEGFKTFLDEYCSSVVIGHSDMLEKLQALWNEYPEVYCNIITPQLKERYRQWRDNIKGNNSEA